MTLELFKGLIIWSIWAAPPPGCRVGSPHQTVSHVWLDMFCRDLERSLSTGSQKTSP